MRELTVKSNFENNCFYKSFELLVLTVCNPTNVRIRPCDVIRSTELHLKICSTKCYISNVFLQHLRMAPPTGAQIIARSLRNLGVTVLFGIVGIPVVEIAEEAINLGIRFIGFRNEQAASYAASAYGYLTGRPGVCLVVGGPGVLHAMAGVRTIH